MPELAALLRGELELGAPLRLALLAALAAGLGWLALRRGPARVAVADAGPALRARAGDAVWLACTALRAATLGLLALAAAEPLGWVRAAAPAGSGLDLVIALDASASMAALDGQIEGRRASRLQLAKAAVADFIRGRPRDRIGLVVFGEHAFSAAPLTLDHAQLLAALERVKLGVAGDATALGEAIGLATRRLLSGAEDGAAPQRVVLLLTDGRHNSGALAPETAAAIAARDSVRVHAVGLGSSGPVPFGSDTPDAPLRFERVDLDVRTLRAVAERTGGRFLHVERPQDLARIGAWIQELERPPAPRAAALLQASLLPWFALAALAALCAEALLGFALCRRLP